MKRQRILPLVLALLWGLFMSSAGSLAAEADAYWQCKTTSPAGWCPTSLTNPLPITFSGAIGVGGTATAADPTYSEGISNPLSLDLSGHLRVVLSTNSAVIGHVITDSGSTSAVTQATGTNLHTVLDSGTLTAVTGITNALPAGANLLGKTGIDQTTPGTTNGVVVNSGTLTAVTAITNALPAGANVIGHVIADTGSTTAVTQATGTNLHAVLDSGTLTTLTTLTGITNALPSGTNLLGKTGIDQTTAVTTNGVIIAPSSSTLAGIAAVVSSALETGHVLKASAGNLYGVQVVTTSVAGYLEVFNSTTVPAAGAVTPVAACYVGAFGTCALQFAPPLVMATGISVAFSASTTPFTKTDSATAFLSGQTQ